LVSQRTDRVEDTLNGARGIGIVDCDVFGLFL
jgi:hypothetical protein